MWSFISAVVVLVALASPALSQDLPQCGYNELLRDKECVCSPGYFNVADEAQKERCDNECDEVYWTIFTFGKCNKDLYSRIGEKVETKCNAKCTPRLRLWTIIGLLIIFAASVVSLLFTLPICIATCSSCLHAKKANKHAKRVVMESQVNSASKDQQVASMGYNPYAYWPYYGRS